MSLGVGAACITTSCTASANGQKSPNLVFILVDDMGYGELSCYNPSTIVATPNIDRLADSGVMMTQAYASPLSSPTRTSFLTGAFPQRSGVYENSDGVMPGIGPSRHCFVDELRDAGYTTVWFGKWHQGWDVSNHPLNNGFDKAYGFLGGMHDYFDPAEGDHYAGGPFARHSYIFDGIKPVKEMKYLTEELTDRAVDFIGSDHGGSPFFLYLPYNCPHTPYQAPDEVIVKYLKKGMEPVQAIRCAMMDVLDTQVGRVLDALEKNGLDKNTLVVFMSDNGAEQNRYNGGLRGVKNSAWEGGIRVPMIARWPGRIPAGHKSSSVCSIIDLASTFIGAAKGMDDFSYGDGVNLLPYYDGSRTDDAHTELVFSINLIGQPYLEPAPEHFGLFAVRSGDWKLVFDKKRGIDALYNLKDDVAEEHDLSDEFHQKKKELLEYGRKFLEDCPPCCSKIHNRNTRIDGDRLKIDSLINHCNNLNIN